MKDRFQIRRDKLRSILKKDGVNAMIVTNFINVTYLTGFTGDDSYLIVAQEGDTLISDFRYGEQIEKECSGLTAYIRPIEESMPKAAFKLLKSVTPKRLGVEENSMTLALRDNFAAVLDDWDLIGLKSPVERLRMVKDKSEIDLVRKAGTIAARAFECVKAGLRAEQTEIELKNQLEYAMKQFGAENVSFSSIIAVGEWASLCHAVPGDRRVHQGELLLIDWGATYKGYMSDNTRTLVTTPKPSSKLRKLYEIVLQAHRESAAAIAPGKRCRDIDAVARSIITDAGYGKFFGHGLGHALGLEIHENPRFNTVTETILEPGMILTIEPGIYLPGWGGIRIEDDYLVTKTGAENLTPRLPIDFDAMMADVE
ncbi:MAG: Xaa-Pro peptidase family protein [Planctomycetaceae bacterium]|jgi:Xaa-Pro aminopeptidase|nr:Xaa-Pro peptidase family protein [Planctomycetaceae bacterium]